MGFDAKTGQTAAAVKTVLHAHYGHRIAGIYVFGSRARGDHSADSDLDLAVVLRDAEEPLSALDGELLDILYPVEIEQGVHIQPWALPMPSVAETAGRSGGSGLRTRLAAAVRRDGVAL